MTGAGHHAASGTATIGLEPHERAPGERRDAERVARGRVASAKNSA